MPINFIGFCVAIQNIHFKLSQEKKAKEFYSDLKDLFNKYGISASFITFNGRIS